MKAAWFIVNNKNNAGEPDLPDSVGGSFVNPLNIYVITGAQHRHTLVGGNALKDANLSGQAAANRYHTHTVVRLDSGNWFQDIDPDEATSHTHDLALDANGELIPDFFMVFWKGSDFDYDQILSWAGVIHLADAEIDGDQIGDLIADPWTQPEEDNIRSKFMSVLGIDLPSQVNGGKRLVQYICPAMLARAGQNERSLRFTTV